MEILKPIKYKFLEATISTRDIIVAIEPNLSKIDGVGEIFLIIPSWTINVATPVKISIVPVYTDASVLLKPNLS